MIDINLIRKTPDVVRENIKKKFQDSKLPLVDEVISLDAESRAAKAGKRLRPPPRRGLHAPPAGAPLWTTQAAPLAA